MDENQSLIANGFNRRKPSSQTVSGLNGMLFFISDVRHGIGPLLAIYLKGSLGWDSEKIGLALAMPDISSALTQIPAGLLADAVRVKRLLIIVSCILITIGCALIFTFATLPIIIYAQLLMGIATAIIPPAIGAITLGLFGRLNLPRRVSQNEMWNHAGNVFTALTVGTAAYLLGHQWIFYLVAMFALASIASTLFIRPKEIDYRIARELAEEDPTKKVKPEPTPLLNLLKRKPIIIFNLSLVIYYLANAAQIGLVGQILANNNPGSDSLFIAACVIVAEFVMIGVAYLMSLVINRFGRKTFLLVAFLILPIRATLYTLTNYPPFLLAIQILDGIEAGILGVIGTIINSDLAIGTGRFNFLQGLGSLSTSLGASLSNVIAGLIVSAFGFNAGFFTLASIAILGALFFGCLMPETKMVMKTS